MNLITELITRTIRTKSRFIGAAVLIAVQLPYGGSTHFECVYSIKATLEGLKKESFQADFILDLGRKKAYVTRDRQNIEVQYYLDTKDTLITFVEVTDEKRVNMATVNGNRASVYNTDTAQFYGYCFVK